MKRILIALFLIILFLIGADAQFKRTCEQKTPCADSINDCPKEGCSANNHHDPELNTLKNLKSSTKPVEDRTITAILRLEKKVEDSGYEQGDSRKVLRDLGEGSQIRVVGYLLAVKQECGESCNCGLADVDVTTDNHLVLVNPKVVTDNPLPENAKKKQLTAVFKVREPLSMTAEFTPRVRANGHPNFTSELQNRINKTPQGALWVRVTGQLFFDSEHFHQKPLKRKTSWEVHPILNFEYCLKGRTCKIDSDENWQDLDKQP
jgi:hypothetical protein